jgi:hypothetical protein
VSLVTSVWRVLDFYDYFLRVSEDAISFYWRFVTLPWRFWRAYLEI